MNKSVKVKQKSKRDDREDYKLNTSAVDRLVDATQGKVAKVDDSEVDQYKSGKLRKIPTFVKAILIKWWFAGACCFFFLWGLGTVIPNQTDLIFVLAFGLGVVTDYLCNNLLRMLESSDREYDKWILFPWRKWWSIFLNVAFSFIATFLVVKTYDLINALIIESKQLDPTSVPLGVEPLLFGVFYTAIELAVVWLRNLVIFLIKKIVKKGPNEEIM